MQYLREIYVGTPNACWVPAAKGDPGAVAFIPVGQMTIRAIDFLVAVDTMAERIYLWEAFASMRLATDAERAMAEVRIQQLRDAIAAFQNAAEAL